MKTIVLTSGGIDSSALLNLIIEEGTQPIPLFVNYGQKSLLQELEAVKKICEYYKLKPKIADVGNIISASTGEIPGRNAILIFAALGIIGLEPGIISLGIHNGTDYADCSQEFVGKMQGVLDVYMKGMVKISAPFLNWKKTEIWDYCIDSGIPVELCYSCELGDKQPCGNCKSCKDLDVLYAIKN